MAERKWGDTMEGNEWDGEGGNKKITREKRERRRNYWKRGEGGVKERNWVEKDGWGREIEGLGGG